jgi:ABC-type multidrug transport system ATPase subunit
MYSHLNLIINDFNSIGINKLGESDIVRNIISLLPQQKYGSIIIILHNMEDLSQMTSALLIDKIVAFEMSRKMGQEEPTSSRLNDFACDEHKKMKGKKKVESPSSSSEEEKSKEENGDEKDDPPSTSSFEDEEIA